VIERLWGKGVHLDVDQGINTAVRKIRMCLRDRAENPTYIQTVVGKGYRFIPPVSISQPAIMTAPVEALPKIEDPDPSPTTSSPFSQPRIKSWLIAAIASTSAITGLVSFWYVHREPRPDAIRAIHSTIFPVMRPRTTSWMV
jgi:hypothetical protein